MSDSLQRLIDAAVKCNFEGSREPGGGICLCLSGGVDSNAILSSLVRQGLLEGFRLVSFAGSSQFETADSVAARKVADLFNLPISLVTLPNDISIAELETVYKKAPYFISDPSLFYFDLIAKACRSQGVKVALTGDGGDEIFGSYRRRRIYKLLESKIAKSILKLSCDVAIRLKARSRRIQTLYEYSRDSHSLERYWNGSSVGVHGAPTWSEIIPDADSLEFIDFLSFCLPNGNVRSDLAFITNGVENRSPLLDRNILGYAKQAGVTKGDLRATLSSQHNELLTLPKSGFEMTFEALFRSLDLVELKEVSACAGPSFSALNKFATKHSGALTWDQVDRRTLTEELWLELVHFLY